MLVPDLLRRGEEYREQLAKGAYDSALLATRSLLEKWREELLAAAPCGAVGGLGLLLFGGLARLILGPLAPRPAGEVARLTAADLALARQCRAGGLGTLGAVAEEPSLAGEVLLALDELARGRVPQEALFRLAGRHPRLADLARLRREYLEIVRRAGIAGTEDLLAAASEVLASGDFSRVPFRRLLVYGFTDFTPLQADLLRALARGPVEVTVLLPRPEDGEAAPAAQFPDWPTAVDSVTEPAARPAELQELAGEGESALHSLIARTIIARMAADPSLRPEDIALVQRDPRPGCPLAASLRRHGLRVRESSGPPLLGLNAVGAIMAALDCAARDWPRAALLRLSRGVFTGERSIHADALARTSARLDITRTREAWRALATLAGDTAEAETARAAEAVALLDRALSLLPSRGTTARFLEALRAFLAFWGFPGSWWPGGAEEEGMAAYAREMAGIARLLALLAEAAGVERALGEERIWGTADFASYFSRLVTGASLPAPAEDGAVHCLDPSEIRGLRFRLVFLVGLAEGQFPKPLAENWLLPEEIRPALSGPGYGLELRPSLAAREHRLLRNVLEAAGESLYLCWSAVDGRGEPAAPSLFLSLLRRRTAGGIPVARLSAADLLPRDPAEAWDGAGLRGRILADYLWEKDRRSAPGADACVPFALLERADAVRGRPPGVLTEPEIAEEMADRFPAARIIGLSMLEDYAVCPYLFFARHILGLAPAEQPDEEPDGSDLGQAYHTALERFFRGRDAVGLSGAAAGEALTAAVIEAFAPLRAAARTGLARRMAALQQEACRQRLTILVRAEARRAAARGAWRTAHAELGFGLASHRASALDPASVPDPLLLGDGETALRLAGKIDRVDFFPNGAYLVYDYKLGRAPRPAEVLSGRSLQIPIYLLAARSLFFPGFTPAGGGYYSLRDRSRRSGLWRASFAALTGISPRAAGSLPDPAWEEGLAGLTGRALAAIAGIRRGEFTPAAEGCPPHCDFHQVCRREGRA